MPDKRETKLWNEIGWLRFLLAITVTLILGIVYFAVWQWNTSIWRELLLSSIANLIPVPLVFILAYIAFRRIEELRSERDSDEIADKVILRLIEIAKVQASTSGENNNFLDNLPPITELYLKLSHELEITNKFFDSKSKPQKLVVQFTNRGSNIIHLKKITYSDMVSGLPKAALSKNYRLDNGRNILIPVDQSQAEILPERKYIIELLLDGKWDIDKINGWTGKWGYLHLELMYGTETENVQYTI
jgi:hypothetical protein